MTERPAVGPAAGRISAPNDPHFPAQLWLVAMPPTDEFGPWVLPRNGGPGFKQQSGCIAGVFTDRGDAVRLAEAAGGLVVTLPIVADFRP